MRRTKKFLRERVCLLKCLAFVSRLLHGAKGDLEKISKDARPSDLAFQDVEEKLVYDDLTGEPLPGDLVKQTTQEELTEMYRRRVWAETTREICRAYTGAPPISVRWVIINKGDSRNPITRARLVAKHIATKYGGKIGMYELFAAIPPFEMIKVSFASCCSMCVWVQSKCD